MGLGKRRERTDSGTSTDGMGRGKEYKEEQNGLEEDRNLAQETDRDWMDRGEDKERKQRQVADERE